MNEMLADKTNYAMGEFVWALLKQRGKSVFPCVEPKRRDEY